MIKTIVTALITALVVALASVGVLVGDNQSESLGGGTNFTNGLSYGGKGVTTLTDDNGGTYSLSQSELLNSTVFRFAAGGSGQAVIALAFPGTTSMTGLIPRAGECREWIYDATALAAGTTTTMTAGTGHNIIAYTTADDVIDGNEYAEIRMCRKASGDVDTFVTEMLNAD